MSRERVENKAFTPYIFDIPMDYFEGGQPFCGNPNCLLHVRVGDLNVRGSGNWATLPGGLIVGRGIYEGRYLCDTCGVARIAQLSRKVAS